MNHKSVALVALLTVCTGCLITLGVGFEPSRPLATDVTADNEYAQVLQQHIARLDRIEQLLTALTHARGDTGQTSSSLKGNFVGAPLGETVLRQEVGRILREELWDVLAAVEAGKNSTRAEEIAVTKVLNTPENIAAYAKAHDVVRVALSNGHWTDGDAQELRQSFAYLIDEQLEEVLQILVPAINRGEIELDTNGLPF